MTQSTPVASPGLVKEILATLRLASPLTAVQISLVALSLVDTACIGRDSIVDLAALTLGNAIVFTVTVIGFGLSMALEPLSSQSVGAGEHDRAWQWWRITLQLCALAALPLIALSIGICYALPAFGIEPAVVQRTVDFAWVRSPSILFQLIFVAGRSYLQSYEETWSILVAAILGNLINYAMNMLLVFGDESLQAIGLPGVGLPRLGVVGVGLATTASSALMAALVYRRVHRRARPHVAPASPVDRLKLLRIGLPLGFQLAAEVGIFTTVAIVAGHLGKIEASAHQIAINLASFTFMASLGLSAAASVRVGHAIGRGDTVGARRAGLLAIAVGMLLMLSGAVSFLLFPEQLAYLFTDNRHVLLLAAKLLGVAAMFQLFDGLQGVVSGALRGAGDVRFPFAANVVCHWGIGLPVALVLCFSFELGAVGLWYGLTAGLVTISLVLGARFLHLTGRAIART